MGKWSATMVDDSEIVKIIDRMGPEEIADQLDLRRVIREGRSKEMVFIRKSMKVEQQISDVLAMLIPKIDESRGPLPGIFYGEEIEISRTHILKSVTELKEIKDLFQQAENIYQRLMLLESARSKKYSNLENFEKGIYHQIKDWDKALLRMIQAVSLRVVTAIQGARDIVRGIIDVEQAVRICVDLTTLKEYQNNLKTEMAAELMLTADMEKESVYHISWAYTWLLFIVFQGNTDDNGKLIINKDVLGFLTRGNITNFGLPNVLAYLG